MLALAGIKTGFVGLLRWMAGHPFLALAIFLFAWRSSGEVLKVYWDWRIDRMCASEPMLQILVSERVPPDPQRIDASGPYVPSKSDLPSGYGTDYKVGDIYYKTWTRDVIREGSPRVTRYITEVFRANGGQVLARSTYYGRSGGDFVVIDHPTSYGCGSGADGAIYKALFLKGD